ncbi:MAG TPA: hypothetical protein VF184_06205 [Phycisphaeraceae bacterium]
MSGPDYIVDIASLKAHRCAQGGQSAASLRGRPWLAVHWKCCQVYSRIYRNRQGDAYEGRCPRCGSPVRARIGPGGTDARFFEAG